MSYEKKLAIQPEVGKLVNVNFFKEIEFQTWMENSVLVKKSIDK